MHTLNDTPATNKTALNRQQRRMLEACDRKKQRVNLYKLPRGHNSTLLIDCAVVVLKGGL